METTFLLVVSYQSIYKCTTYKLIYRIGSSPDDVVAYGDVDCVLDDAVGAGEVGGVGDEGAGPGARVKCILGKTLHPHRRMGEGT